MVRIRKNSKLSPLLFCSQPSADDDLQPRVCTLNQSPWDVIVPSLLEDSSHQFEAEDGLYVNGSLGHAIGAEQSVPWPMDIDDKPENTAVLGGISTEDFGFGFRRCRRNNGKSWQCSKEARDGLRYCDNHGKRETRRNVNYCICTKENNNSNTTCNDTAKSLPSKKAIVAAKTLPRTRGSKVVANKGAAALKNPYEFYYYSGFNAQWGKKRGISKHREEDKVASAENVGGATPTTSCTTTQISNPESPPSHKIEDYIEDDLDDDDQDEDGGGEWGRKRMRRHVKARSLKSLM